jgi:hypothetical protein
VGKILKGKNFEEKTRIFHKIRKKITTKIPENSNKVSKNSNAQKFREKFKFSCKSIKQALL